MGNEIIQYVSTHFCATCVWEDQILVKKSYIASKYLFLRYLFEE